MALFVLHWVMGLCPPLNTIRLADFPGRIIIVVPQSAAVFAWLLCGLLLVLLSLFSIVRRRAAGRAPSALEKAQARLTLLPVLALATRLLQVHFPVFGGNLLFIGAPASMAWALCGAYAPKQTDPAPARGASCRAWLLVTLLFTLVYWLTGWYFTASVGEHSGDEGHFLVQAESLWNDHDLDIGKALGYPPAESAFSLHISPNSLPGHRYSWHTPGLSFLLAPTVPGGWPLRHLVLGLIAGLGLAGFFSLCRRLSRDRVTPVLLLLLLGLSTLWGVYACRALPEVLGAALTVCGALAIMNQRERPWSSLALLLLLLAALPFAYTRFLPVALALGGCYGLFELLEPRPWRAKLFRLVIFSLGALAGQLGFLCFQAHLFGWHMGLSFSSSSVVFAPIFAWYTLASSRGILMSFPLFACVLPAFLCLLCRREHWRFGLTATLVFLSVFLTWCSSNFFQGGSTLPGRFLLVTIPVLTAALAALLPKAGPGFRGLTFFLGLLSVTIFLTQLASLPLLHNEFSAPYEIDLVQPLFIRLVRLLHDPSENAAPFPIILLYGGTALLLLRPAWPRLAQGAVLVLMATGLAVTAHPSPNVHAQGCTSASLCFMDTARARFLVCGDTQLACPLWQGLPPRRHYTPAVIAREPPPERADDLIRYDDIGDNDWEQRGYRWATLVCPAAGGSGQRIAGLVAQLAGEVAAEFVIREGSHTLVSKKYPPHATIRDLFTFETHNNGDLYFLVRLEGREGAWQQGLIAISPSEPDLLKKAHLTLPTVADVPMFPPLTEKK